jgi:non-heme chloroperoxidase
MPIVKSHDGTELFCRRWGVGPPVVFVHGWALNSDAWQSAMLQTVRAGFQAVAYDRRGHGRSDDPGRGYDYDSLADDLAAVLEDFEVRDATLVGHSMGCGEITRYLTRYGDGRVARVVMAAPQLPFALKTADNPDGPAELASLEAMRAAWVTSFVGWLAQAAPPAFGPKAPPELIAQTVQAMLRCSLQAAIECNITGSQTDLRPELAKIATPTLVLHGDADGSCPFDFTGGKLPGLMPNCRLKVYQGATHTLIVEQAAEMVDDILAFIGQAAVAKVA